MIFRHDGLDHLSDVSRLIVADDVLNVLVEVITVDQKLELITTA